MIPHMSSTTYIAPSLRNTSLGPSMYPVNRTVVDPTPPEDDLVRIIPTR